MIVRSAIAAIVATVALVPTSSPAVADDSAACDVSSSGSAGHTNFGAGVQVGCPDDKPDPVPTGIHYEVEDLCAGGGSCVTCPPGERYIHVWAVHPDGTTETVSIGCSPSQDGVTAADVAAAFTTLDLAPATLIIQPPDGLTLVNFKTNFYSTTTSPVSKSMSLAKQAVTIEATPATYTWHFGDGRSTRTSEPGAPYPELIVTHEYLRKGDYLPSLSVTYTGRFKIGEGAWQTIPSTVTIDGPGQPLRAIEAQPKLVGY